MYKINDSVTVLHQVGPKQSVNLARLGIYSLADLLYHFPAYYRDTSNIVTLAELDRESRKTVKVTLDELKNIRIRGGKTLQKGRVSDVSGSINVTWFNQPFLAKSLPVGAEIYLSGKLSNRSPSPELIGPDYEVVKIKNINLGKIVPVYPLTEGVTLKWLRTRMDDLISHINEIDDLEDPLPEDIREDNKIIGLKEALTQIHTPDSEAAIILARKRLAFDELLQIYFKIIQERQERLNAKAAVVKRDIPGVRQFTESLPFKLTESQNQAISEILEDLNKPHPMYRLLQGDVGSGKTIVALVAALAMIESGYQVVLLAPTTVLAGQHYDTINKFLGSKIKVGLLTNATAKSIKSDPHWDLIIATHSILYHQELLHNLGLLIIDEQHRFGVKQRQELLELKTQQLVPHLLNLTATPIPRSIALTLFGEMDVSVISKPSGRKACQTFVVPTKKRADSYGWLKDRLTNHASQLFWICPLIETNNSEEPGAEDTFIEEDLKAVTAMSRIIKKQLPGARIGILHGKLKNIEKDKLIQNFKDHKLDILVSTTVIEVGIDIPGADIIVIENAERFGLAQLHQLRGRVGRNNQDSWCLLFTGLESTPEVVERLQFFAKESNGIKIAEYDLKTRGPGEVYGTIQAGIPNLKIANFGNSGFLMQVREAAQQIINFTTR